MAVLAVFRDTIWDFPSKNCGELRRASVRTADAPAEDRNGHLPDTHRNFQIKLFYKICFMVTCRKPYSFIKTRSLVTRSSGVLRFCRLVNSKELKKMNICQLICCNITGDPSLQQPPSENLKHHMLCGISLRFLSEFLSFSSTQGVVKSGDMGGHTPLSNNLLLFRP